MPSVSKLLNTHQAFNFKKDQQASVGFLFSLEIGGRKFAPDLKTIPDPLNPTAKFDKGVTAVLDNYYWTSGTADAMQFSGLISTENRQKLAEMLLGSWANIEVKFEVAIYEYDPATKKFFKSVHVDNPLNGLLEKNGSDLNIEVADEPSRENQSPQVYQVRFGVKPSSEEQQVHLAVGEKKTVSKQWGISEKA